MYNKIVNSPQNVKSRSVLSPGIGSYDIDPIKNNTYFTSSKSEK